MELIIAQAIAAAFKAQESQANGVGDPAADALTHYLIDGVFDLEAVARAVIDAYIGEEIGPDTPPDRRALLGGISRQ